MTIDVDVLVLGSGIAGLSFALKASEFGRVALVTKKSDTESSTNYAQGGIAAVMDPNDTYESHIRDTHVAGGFLCHEDAVDILVKEGPERVRELMDFGVRFTHSERAKNPMHLDLGREGGHSTRRIVHAADLTGREIERALVAKAKANYNIRLFEHDHAIDLITTPVPLAGARPEPSRRDGRGEEAKHIATPSPRAGEGWGEGADRRVCRGAYVLDSETGDVTAFRARVTLLATGGLGHVYLHTTNPEIATGDGVAMAFRAGALVANMEFIQFHPTTLYHPGARSFLISEAVRGEGGILRLKNGERFMQRYHEMACLAPRDVVARAIDAELKASGDECVYLDVTHLDPALVKGHFPNIYEKCLSVGIDITKDWIPIVPAAHYSCGGVMTDHDARTTIDNLYACGEVACTGVHGANRLASNSLLEAVVFARRAALDVEKRIGSIGFEDIADYDADRHAAAVDQSEIADLRLQLQTIMWKYVGIVRTNDRLAHALGLIREIGGKAESFYATGRLSPELLELRNMALTAELIILSAQSRKESRGLHYNTDYPDTDDACCKRDTVIVQNSGRLPELVRSDV